MKNRVNSSEKVNWPWRYSVRKEGSSAPHSKRRKRLSCRLLSLLPLHSREMRKASNKTEDFITDNFNSKLRLALLSAFLLFGGALTYFIHNTYDFPLSIFAGKQLHFRVSPTCSKGKSSPGRAHRAGRERELEETPSFRGWMLIAAKPERSHHWETLSRTRNDTNFWHSVQLYRAAAAAGCTSIESRQKRAFWLALPFFRKHWVIKNLGGKISLFLDFSKGWMLMYPLHPCYDWQKSRSRCVEHDERDESSQLVVIKLASRLHSKVSNTNRLISRNYLLRLQAVYMLLRDCQTSSNIGEMSNAACS